MQPNLFPQIPLPHAAVWEQLSAAERSALIEALAQLVARAAVDPTEEQESGDH